MNEPNLEDIVDTIEEHDIDRAISRLNAEAEYYRQYRIRRQILDLKEQIRRLESCL